MTRRALLAPLVVLLALAPPTLAEGCTPTTSRPEVDAAGFYVDVDPCFVFDCMVSVWVYQESNDIPGLQRNDDFKDDTCGGMIDSDFPGGF